MSIAYRTKRTRDLASRFQPSQAQEIESLLASVQEFIAPVWPLRDYVAVNPYGGFADQKFLQARKSLGRLSSCELFMPLAYYAERLSQGHFGLDELRQAIDEMVADGIPGAEHLHAHSIHQRLSDDAQFAQDADRAVWSMAESYDQHHGTHWADTIAEEIGKVCAAHYDEGQASWLSPHRDLPLYQAWREGASQDRQVEWLGLNGFRDFVKALPPTPEAAVFVLLHKAQIPPEQWSDYLLCLAFSLPGWSAWTKYQTAESAKRGFENPDFAALLAIRLAYDVAIAETFEHAPLDAWKPASASPESTSDPNFSSSSLLGMCCLRANEIALRNRMLRGMQERVASLNAHAEASVGRKLAQMVFCIDVRSERMRRHLESVTPDVETVGFAGFFGLPFEYVRLGDQSGTNQLPVLLDPKFKVYEGIRGDGEQVRTAAKHRSRIRNMRALWKSFQSSAVSCFAFVESNGLLFAGNFVRRLLNIATPRTKLDGVASADHAGLGPTFRDLNRQGITTSHQVDLAESILRGTGLTDGFAKLVVFCGHGSSTENNPLQAGLDCGACAGHTGEANARFAAMLLNEQYVRQGLAERGIQVPDDTRFVAGLHNTTTDEISFFDTDVVPASSRGFLDELQRLTLQAGHLTRQERLSVLPGETSASLMTRSNDWSEVRPEWGLTGNAAFVIAPRDLSKYINLDGASFLHNYDYRRDTEGALLEQIMTAPLVVANWINMQYYASTVDQDHFGSGTKTIHNVVGKFGVFSGNGGDLTTGLPWESIHNGQQYQHDPMRLLAVIETPRSAVDRILEKHENVRQLIENGWVNLVVLDGEQFYRYTENHQWQTLHVGLPVDDQQSASMSLS